MLRSSEVFFKKDFFTNKKEILIKIRKSLNQCSAYNLNYLEIVVVKEEEHLCDFSHYYVSLARVNLYIFKQINRQLRPILAQFRLRFVPL